MREECAKYSDASVDDNRVQRLSSSMTTVTIVIVQFRHCKLDVNWWQN